MITRDLDELVRREVQVMAAAGWRLHQRGPDGAVFTSGATGSGISAGVHLILLVLTVGLWLPFLIIVEVAAMTRTRFCRLTFDSQGRAQYQPIKKPPR